MIKLRSVKLESTRGHSTIIKKQWNFFHDSTVLYKNKKSSVFVINISQN